MAGVIVAFPSAEDASKIRVLLQRSGFTVTACCQSGVKVLQAADRVGLGTVVCGYRLRDMIYSELFDNLPHGFAMLLLASARVIPSRLPEGIMAVPMPLQVYNLTQALETLDSRAERLAAEARTAPHRRSRYELKVISQAKALLMERNGMSEEQAHRYLQKTSMENGVSLIETAGMILSLMR